MEQRRGKRRLTLSSLADETLCASGAARALRKTTERLATEVPGESSCFGLGARRGGGQLSFDMIIALAASLALNVRIPPGVLPTWGDPLLRTGVGGHLLGPLSAQLKLVRGGAVRPLAVVPQRRSLPVSVRLQLSPGRFPSPARSRAGALEVFSLSPQWITELGVVQRRVPPGRGQLRRLPPSSREAADAGG